MKSLPLLCALLFLGAGHESSGSVRILTYHSFLGGRNMYSFSLEELERQCRSLIAAGYTFVSFNDIRNGSVRGGRNILLTIDDGHRTVSDAYWKVLVPLNIKPLLAIYPAFIGADKNAMTWQQLREIADHGATIASHGYDHLYVNEKLFRKDPKAFRREIYDSRSRLEEKLRRPVDVFVYPFGARSPITVRTVREAGYRYAMTVDGGPADLSLKRDSGFREMPRYLLTRSGAQAIFASLAGPEKPGSGRKMELAARKEAPGSRDESAPSVHMTEARRPGDDALFTEKKDRPAMMADYKAQLSEAVMTVGFKPPVTAEGRTGKDGALSEKIRWKDFSGFHGDIKVRISGFHGDIKVRISGLMDLFRDTCRRFAGSIQNKIAVCRSRIENWLKSPGFGKSRGSRV
jgi:peptidoglycan/xylan/chitin deacetylase (PgdA/CDA1 family)